MSALTGCRCGLTHCEAECFVFVLQTVLNTMCGYGMQQQEERSAGQEVFTIGCLEKIVWWARNNLLLVAGLTAGLLLLEVITLT